MCIVYPLTDSARGGGRGAGVGGDAEDLSLKSTPEVSTGQMRDDDETG